jgi:uncharacterized coiled-coil protein SlyX
MHADFQFIVMFAGFAITIGTLIWRMAILHHQCMTNKESLIRAHERISKLEDTQSNKIEELSAQLNSVKEAQIRMEEKLNILLKIKEGKEL